MDPHASNQQQQQHHHHHHHQQQQPQSEPEPPSSITNSSGSNNNNPPTSRAERADAAKPTYTSPSDTIMSPTSKKLSQIKGRRFATAKPPQPMLLVAKTATTAGG